MKFRITLLCSLFYLVSYAQDSKPSYPKIDSTNFNKLYPYALRGNMKAVFDMLKVTDDTSLTEKQKEKKKTYYERFIFRNEAFDFNTADESLVSLYKLFQNYWRSILIEGVSQKLADSLFRGEMTYYLKAHHKSELTVQQIQKDYYTLFQDFFRSRGVFGIGVGKTGHLYDLYLWKEQEEKQYSITLPEGQKIEVPVIFMKNFISNGWSHYTTIGHSFTGGWATREKLFCVDESYESKEDERFLISYISHEGQHFGDYLLYPNLRQVDLEYRAKLTELTLAQEITHDLLKKFIGNAKNDVSYAHGFANYTLIKMFSNEVFDTEFESEMAKWKTIPVKRINKIALKLLKTHSKKLKQLGAETVETYITTI